MRYVPAALLPTPALAHPGAPAHDAGWFTVAFGALLIAVSVIVLVKSQ